MISHPIGTQVAPNWLLGNVKILFWEVFISFLEIHIFTAPGVVAAEGGETAPAPHLASQKLLCFFRYLLAFCYVLQRFAMA